MNVLKHPRAAKKRPSLYGRVMQQNSFKQNLMFLNQL